MFTLKIKTDNAAFEDDKAAAVASILRDIVTSLEDLGGGNGKYTDSIQDANGNTVGRWSLR